MGVLMINSHSFCWSKNAFTLSSYLRIFYWVQNSRLTVLSFKHFKDVPWSFILYCLGWEVSCCPYYFPICRVSFCLFFLMPTFLVFLFFLSYFLLATFMIFPFNFALQQCYCDVHGHGFLKIHSLGACWASWICGFIWKIFSLISSNIFFCLFSHLLLRF